MHSQRLPQQYLHRVSTYVTEHARLTFRHSRGYIVSSPLNHRKAFHDTEAHILLPTSEGCSVTDEWNAPQQVHRYRLVCTCPSRRLERPKAVPQQYASRQETASSVPLYQNLFKATKHYQNQEQHTPKPHFSTAEMTLSRLEAARNVKQSAQNLIDILEKGNDEAGTSATLKAQARLRNSNRELERITLQPSEFLCQLAVSQQLFVCIHWLCYFKVIFHIPTNDDESISYADLAHKASVSVVTMKSVVRMAMIFGFLRETPGGHLQHTPLSAGFATNSDTYNWMMYMAKETAPTVACFVKASERWPNSEDKTETAYSLSRDTDLSFFDHVNLSPESANEFGTYMKSQAANKEGTSVRHLRQGFDWASLGDATVVDVGGGGGDASMFLAEEFPELKFVVQDLPTAIETARQRATLLPRTISERIQCQEHNFFDVQRVKGGAVYLLRMILHDWPDHDCVRILSRLSAAMQPGGHIVIMDMVLPKPGSMALEHEAILRQKDLVMKQNFNAKERELEEWEALVDKAGLRVDAVVTPLGSQHSILAIVQK